MKYIDSWLTGLGLEYIVPKLKANGITTPKKLAALRLVHIIVFYLIMIIDNTIIISLREMYEVVGVEDADDRKKLYFLIQRLQAVIMIYINNYSIL